MGDMMLKELARICGVAVSTASRALNDREGINAETRDRILATAKQYGYVPNASARSLKISANRTISVIIQGEPSPLLIDVLLILEEAFGKAGFATTLSHVPVRSAHFATVERIVRDGKFAGVVFLGRYGDAQSTDSHLLSMQLAELEVPIVFCTTSDYSGLRSTHSSVCVDDYSGGFDLGAHLAELGHRKIAFVGAGSAQEQGQVWALRFAGVRAALAQAGAQVDQDLMVPSALPGELFTMDNGYRSIQAWLAAGDRDFTALVASCDAVAVGAARALHEAGVRVPVDCSVTGFDGLNVGRYFIPRLATITQPIAEIAQATARVLLATIADPERPTEQVLIRGRLTEGESVAAA